MVFFKSDFAKGVEVLAFSVALDQLVQHFKLDETWNKQFLGASAQSHGNKSVVKFRNHDDKIMKDETIAVDEMEEELMNEDGTVSTQRHCPRKQPVFACSVDNMNCDGNALGTAGNKFLPEPLVPRNINSHHVDEHDMYAQHFSD